VEAIAERLQRDCGPTPLVVAEWRSGRFRCKEVRWAAPQPKRVGSVAELGSLLDNWDGSAPPHEEHHRAEREAREAARRHAETMAHEAEFRQRRGLQRQVDAATFRLRRELARHLRLFGRQDLNGIWRDRMQNGGNTRRYRDAYEKLGGYCDWTPEELQDANRFVESLTSQREFHMSIAPTLDAALNDPRWKAAKTLAEMDER